ncbi:acyltransferase [Alcanivorax sp. CY1518]|uniref:Acyltransferase n=1 Tax=Alcanivorax quisquiliarum TaxID=2933565 RepID=A0ABT0E326_9GAMM|nr:acyltransferase [Alcanivorax quisquiliarum]MCK0536099.1 acyltransferase [Alcanivorax quisquiliarum]
MNFWKMAGFLFYLVEYVRNKSLGAYWSDRIKKRAGLVGSISINGPVQVYGCENIQIGDNVHIGGGAFIVGDGGLSIGDNTHISRNLTLYTRNHNYKGKKLPYDETQMLREVVIGRNVWIGMNVTVLPGARIGDGCIIGAGSVIYGELDKYSIVGAASYNKLGARDEEHYKKLDSNGCYGRQDGK